MPVNRGVVPYDPNTPTGQFRDLFGDTNYVALDPAEIGMANYDYFSDLEINVFLTKGYDSLNRAVGFAYLQLAGQAAIEAASIADYDLKVDTTKRSADLRNLADYWFGLADNEDVSENEVFFVVPTGQSGGEWIPEASPAQYGRQYSFRRGF